MRHPYIETIDKIKTKCSFRGARHDLEDMAKNDPFRTSLSAGLSADMVESLLDDYYENDTHIYAYGQFFQVLIPKNMEGHVLFGVKKNACDCGAKHTSFPSHHYNWCSLKK
jgi:hypothetical protein